MLTKNKDWVLAYCAIDYPFKVGARFAAAADEICEECKPESLTVTMRSYVFQWPSKCVFLTLDIQRLLWQTIGLGAWEQSLPQHTEITRRVLHVLGVEKFNRIGFKVSSYLPLGMTHAEMCQLMLGSFLNEEDQLKDVCDPPYDSRIQLEGDQDGMHYVLQATPMSKEQVAGTLSLPTSEALLKPKSAGSRPAVEFYDRVTDSDVLYYDIDLSRKECPANQLEPFLKQSLETAAKIAKRCVDRLQSKPIK
jgi:hypothetical protein